MMNDTQMDNFLKYFDIWLSENLFNLSRKQQLRSLAANNLSGSVSDSFQNNCIDTSNISVNRSKEFVSSAEKSTRAVNK